MKLTQLLSIGLLRVPRPMALSIGLLLTGLLNMVELLLVESRVLPREPPLLLMAHLPALLHMPLVLLLELPQPLMVLLLVLLPIPLAPPLPPLPDLSMVLQSHSSLSVVIPLPQWILSLPLKSPKSRPLMLQDSRPWNWSKKDLNWKWNLA